MKKIIFGLLFSCLLIHGFKSDAYAYADDSTKYELMNTYILDSRANIAINGEEVTVSASVIGYPSSVTKCAIQIELQVKNGLRWEKVKSWSQESDSSSLSMSETYSVIKGKTYRLKGKATVWSGSKTESADLNSDSKKVN